MKLKLISLIVVLILFLSCKISNISEKINYEDQILLYQKNQFVNPDLNFEKRYVNKFTKLNSELLKNRDSDSFWMILCFDGRRLFEALYLSNTDTIIYALHKDSVIQYRNNLEYVQNYAFLIDKIVKNKKMPFVIWTGRPTLYIACQVNLKLRNIVRKGFNVYNYELIEKFKD